MNADDWKNMFAGESSQNYDNQSKEVEKEKNDAEQEVIKQKKQNQEKKAQKVEKVEKVEKSEKIENVEKHNEMEENKVE